MKCPLCDGTVVNGRCKECGMPYRKDEILYHLNESRSDHYRHASDKARKIMQTQQRAGNTAKNASSGAKGSTGKANSRTVSRQTYKEQQKQIRQGAMRKMTDTGNAGKGWSTAGNTSQKPKKRSKLGILWAIIIILAVLAPRADGFVDGFKEAFQEEFGDSGSDAVQTDTAEIINSDTYFYSWDDDEGSKYYSIGEGFGKAVAGDEFDAGEYGIFTSSDEVTLTVDRKNADNEQYTLKDGDDTLFLTFEDGDSIQVESEESDFDSVYLMEWED